LIIRVLLGSLRKIRYRSVPDCSYL